MIAFYLLLILNPGPENFPDNGLFFQIPGPRKIQGNISKTTDGFSILIQMKPTTCLDETRNQKINTLNLKAYAFSIFNKYVNAASAYKISETDFKIKSANNQSVTGELRLKTSKETQPQKTIEHPKINKQNNVLKITNFNSGKIWNETLDFLKSEAIKDIESINLKLKQLKNDQFDTLVADSEKIWLNTFQQIHKELTADLFLFETDLPEENSRPNLILKAKNNEEKYNRELKNLVENRIKHEKGNKLEK